MQKSTFYTKGSSKLRRFSIIVPVLMALLAVSAQRSHAATYYIAPNGSDSGSGTQASPWKTLSYACSKVTSGNTIYINAGNYTDNNRCNLATGVNIQGAGKGLVTITSAYNGGIATGYIYRQVTPTNPLAHGNNDISGFTLDGSAKTLYTGIFLRGTDNLTIHDIKFQNMLSNAIWIDGYFDWANSNTVAPPTYAQNVVIHDIETNDTTTFNNLGAGPGQGALSLGALQGAKVYNLNLNENYPNRGIGVKAWAGWLNGFKGYNWTIRTDVNNSNAFVLEACNFLGDSEVYNSTFYQSLSLNSGIPTPIAGSTWNLKIHDTVTDFTGTTGALGHELVHNNLDFYNNYIFGNKSGRGNGLWVNNYWTASSVTNWRFRNNIVYNCGAGGLTIEEGALSNIVIENNIFDTISSYPYGGAGILTDGFTGTLSGLKIQNNIFMSCANAPITISSGLSNTLIDHNFYFSNGNGNAVRNSSGSTIMTNNISNGTPGLMLSGSKPKPYYYPSPGSNLVDTGAKVGLPFVGTAPDIGAYEFIPTPAKVGVY